MTSCKTGNIDGGKKRIKEEPTVDIGLRIPELRDTRNDTIGVALYPSAMLYFIDTGLMQSEVNIKLIKQAMKQDLPIRALVYESNQHEIAVVYPATEEDISRHRESQREGINN